MKRLWFVLTALLFILIGCSATPENHEEERTGKVASALVTLVTNQSSYPTAGSVQITFSGGPGNRRDWVAIAPVGAPNTIFDRFAYINHTAPTGVVTLNFTALAKGNYEARFFFNDTYTLLATSAPFHVGPLVSTDRTTYGSNDSIAVTFAHAAPGNGLDWLAIAPIGGNAQSYVRWAYTGGVSSGSQSFPTSGIAAGTYEARLYGYGDVLQAASAPFTITVPQRTVTTDKASYLGSESAVVSFTDAAASGTDWIAIIPDGAPDSAYVAWQYTNQSPNGNVTFSLSALAGGSYVAKLFANNTFVFQAASPVFTITTNQHSIAADKASYVATDTAHISFTSLPATSLDWIAIAPVGSPGSGYVRWQYTGGISAGNLDFAITGLASGSYEARLYANNTLDLKATSAPFSVAAFSVKTDKASYLRTETAQVTFTSAPATTFDWIAIAPEGAPEASYLKWAYTNGVTNGSIPFTLLDLPAGNYVARLFANNVLDLRATSTPFSVSAAAVSTTKNIYAQNESVVVSFGGFPGNPQDWIAIASPGSPGGSFIVWTFSLGEINGTRSFNLAPGNYVARMHVNNGNDILAESSLFTVVPALVITTQANLGIMINGSFSGISLAASGGVPPYSWSLASGSLPPNLTLNANGSITGQAVTQGFYSFTAMVMDSGSHAAERTFTLEVRDLLGVPTLATITPTSTQIGSGPVTITATGTGFGTTTILYLNNNTPLPTTYLSPTQITATVSASLLGSTGAHDVVVYNPPPGGGTSTKSIPFVVTPPNQTWAKIEAGGSAMCGQTTSGTFYCWGAPLDRVFPTLLSLAPVFDQFTVSAPRCGLASGQLYCWGANGQGQAGTSSGTDTPAPLFSGTAFAATSSGTTQSCAITTTGALRCWGSAYGNAGSPSNTIPGTFSAVSSGVGDLVCGLDASGITQCLGANASTFGPLTSQTFTKISVGEKNACGLRADGQAYCWGSNTCEVGVGVDTVVPTPQPVPVPAGVTFSDIHAGCRGGCALATTGDVYCWGHRSSGILGNGSPSSSRALSPILVPELPPISALALSHEGNEVSACGLTASGERWCWGGNTRGQLGIGTKIFTQTPVRGN